MTSRDRAKVVELLRCAADIYNRTFSPFGDARDALGIAPDDQIAKYASDAAIEGLNDTTGDDWARLGYLEAAARVEEGTWPP